MLMSRQELIAMIGHAYAADLDDWIDRGWIRPDRSEDEARFAEVDVARVRLLIELRQDHEVTDGAMPIVVSLIDQVHGLRRALRALTEAVHDLPPEIRDEIRHRIGGTFPPLS